MQASKKNAQGGEEAYLAQRRLRWRRWQRLSSRWFPSKPTTSSRFFAWFFFSESPHGFKNPLCSRFSSVFWCLSPLLWCFSLFLSLFGFLSFLWVLFRFLFFFSPFLLLFCSLFIEPVGVASPWSQGAGRGAAHVNSEYV